MYNYHADIVWMANAALLGVVILTSAAIFLSVIFKNYIWRRRRNALLKIKKSVYETILAHRAASKNVCEAFNANLTPQQFLDIETNRAVNAAFFNDSEQQFFRSCSIRPERG